MQKIKTFLTYNNQAEEAANYYVSLFTNAKVGEIARYGDAGPGPKGGAMVVPFTLEGEEYIALNGGPSFTFTQGFSLMVYCDSQEEVDRLWTGLTAGGKEIACGWLVDKFGVSWQVVPKVLMEMIQDEDPAKRDRVMKAMMGMIKLEIAELKAAYDGK